MVTFIACEIVTGSRLTEILGTHPVRFRLFVVLEGKIDIVKINGASKTLIVTLGKGEFFGEMAVIDGSSRSASAIAAAPNTRVMRINHARFVYLVSQQPAFALMI
ncbi:cyclic nucleotide-binding domain-containing protein [Bradyrhizobium sp.]|uniref:cyclic nucleotide-binding domain-containing protein n=1 Tax=Bradyrhizobium sp. TaxID=376 RepID=UPI003C7DED12